MKGSIAGLILLLHLSACTATRIVVPVAEDPLPAVAERAEEEWSVTWAEDGSLEL